MEKDLATLVDEFWKAEHRKAQQEARSKPVRLEPPTTAIRDVCHKEGMFVRLRRLFFGA